MSTRAARGSARSLILDAALALYAERDPVAVALDDVRAHAGVSAGALYHHFADKAALLGALYVHVLAGYQAEFLAVLDEHPAAEAGVRAVVAHHLEWCAREPVRARLLFAHREAADPVALRDANRGFFAAVLDWYRPHVEAGALRELPLGVLSAIWIGPAQELCRHDLTAHEPGPLADAAWAGLRDQPRET